MTSNVASLRSVKVATPLAPLKRLSLVDLPSANGFDKPSAASKFELYAENNPPYDCRHTEDSLFYEHGPIAGHFAFLQVFQNFQQEIPRAFRGRDVQLFPAGVNVVHLRADGYAVQSRQLFSQ